MHVFWLRDHWRAHRPELSDRPAPHGSWRDSPTICAQAVAPEFSSACYALAPWEAVFSPKQVRGAARQSGEVCALHLHRYIEVSNRFRRVLFMAKVPSKPRHGLALGVLSDSIRRRLQ